MFEGGLNVFFFSRVILISLNFHALVQYKTIVFKAVVW